MTERNINATSGQILHRLLTLESKNDQTVDKPNVTKQHDSKSFFLFSFLILFSTFLQNKNTEELLSLTLLFALNFFLSSVYNA